MLDSKGFDLWAGSYDKSVQASDDSGEYPFAGYRELMNSIYGRIMQKCPVRVLDIGIGTGVLSAKLYEAGNIITGIDFSSAMIETARSKMPLADLIQWDFSAGLPNNLMGKRFDFVVSTYALHHLSDQDKITFISSLVGITKDGGSILIGDVAFKTRDQLELCRKKIGDGWDGDEFYIVFDELSESLSDKCNLSFHEFSHCAGVVEVTL